jgi:hypothetical protein
MKNKGLSSNVTVAHKLICNHLGEYKVTWTFKKYRQLRMSKRIYLNYVYQYLCQPSQKINYLCQHTNEDMNLFN